MCKSLKLLEMTSNLKRFENDKFYFFLHCVCLKDPYRNVLVFNASKMDLAQAMDLCLKYFYKGRKINKIPNRMKL